MVIIMQDQKETKNSQDTPLPTITYLTLNINNKKVNLLLHGMRHCNPTYLDSLKNTIINNKIDTVFIEYDDERIEYYNLNLIQKLKKYGVGGLIFSKYTPPFKLDLPEPKSEVHLILELKQYYSNLILIDKPFSKFCKYYWNNAPPFTKLLIIHSLIHFTLLEYTILQPLRLTYELLTDKYWEELEMKVQNNPEVYGHLLHQDRNEIMAKNIINHIKTNKNLKTGLVVVGSDHTPKIIHELQKQLGDENIIIR